MNTYPRRAGNVWVFPDGTTRPVISGGDGPTTTATPQEVIRENLTKARAIAAKCEEEGRDFTPEERVEVKAFFDAAKAAKVASDKAKADASGDAALIKALGSLTDVTEPLSDAQVAKDLNEWALKGATVGIDGTTKSLGERFVASAEFEALKAAYPNGIGEKARVQMSPVQAPDMLKALVYSTTLPGLVPADQRGPQGPFVWGRQLMLRNVITVGSTTSDVVEYARQLAMTNNAAPTPETITDAADATPTTAEGFKPQSVFTFEKVTTNVKTVAHWLAATKRSLSDVGQLRTLIDSFLRFGLDEELEDQIMSGNGVGENFTGITVVAGTQAQAFSTNAIETIRKGITKVSLVGRARPTAVALHPSDDEGLDLAKDTTNRYFGAGPFGTGPSTIWGLPRVVTEACPVGFAIVADWRFATLWDREQATITATDSHADFFIRNLVAILAELRAAFGVIRPAAFVICDLTA